MLTNGFHAVPKGKLAVVVTYLEMHTQAATTYAPLPDGVTLRQVSPTLDWYRDIFTRVGAQDWLWAERLKLSDAELQTIINHPKVTIFTLTKNGIDEALLELDFRTGDECELAYFGLTTNLIGTGAGRCLMNKAISHAWSRNISRLHVHTCTIDSPQALNFYIRSGFTPYKRAVEIDDDPRITGVLPATAGDGVPVI
ncbi:GNAT family N-acetyltransferase [Sulfitobacter sp. F26169L]|uniref:GNAT family N-acetyltransferase n=1 Tax=Sulfitobacter sp. F26169L TaxID=2996015 RepID=UPI002260E1CE|nr:GNAT family N-acetyltransferase [Sulfitobacter sp. F26169L]MCX7566622.1 GNAT family N-acetyltransferase [Sulfitobacter sp. F26169L]